MCSPRSTHTVALGLVLAALAPATALASNDLRSPDARDAATTSTAIPLLWARSASTPPPHPRPAHPDPATPPRGTAPPGRRRSSW